VFSIPEPVAECLATLRRGGFAAYPVGGCVRDLLLGRDPGDWDIATAAPPEAVMALFEKTVPTGPKHGTVTVLLGGESMEVTTFRADVGYSDGRHPDAVVFGQSLEADLARRDFTVNAMALGADGEIIDPFGGRDDLAQKRVRAVGDPTVRFTEDALRMFRAVRFAAQLSFEIEEGTLAALAALAGNARHVSGERIKVEVEKTLLSPMPHLAALFLSTGLLTASGGPTWTPERLYAAFADVPSEPGPRWRAFCLATGFDITSLPTERRLRAAVLHPEREAVRALALQAPDLMALGFEGPALGRAQLALAQHILEHPETNNKEALATVVRDLQLRGQL